MTLPPLLFMLTEMFLLLNVHLVGLVAICGAALDGLGKLRSEISHGPPELRGQRAPVVFDEDRNRLLIQERPRLS